MLNAQTGTWLVLNVWSLSMAAKTAIYVCLFAGSRGKRLIPVMIENCEVPELLRYITSCNYTKREVLEWFWKRLVTSVKAPLDVKERHSSNQLSSLNLDTSMKTYHWSGSSSSFMVSGQLSSSSSSPRLSSSNTDNAQATNHQYLEFPPASPRSQRKFNEYQQMGNLSNKNRGHSSIAPPRNCHTERRSEPPPLPPRQNTRPLQNRPKTEPQEHFCWIFCIHYCMVVWWFVIVLCLTYWWN